MATRPDKFPDWATDDVVSPISTQNNVVEPSAAKKTLGWDYREKPVRQFMNWLQRYYALWIRYLDEGKLTTTENLSDLDDVPTARNNLGLGTGALGTVTTSATDITAGRLLKVGDVNAVGRVDYRELLQNSNATLTAYRSYYVKAGTNYSLPDTASLAEGASVSISKSPFALPNIVTFGAEEIVTQAGNVSNYQIQTDSEFVFVWNGTDWEIASGEATAGFEQSLLETGYQILPGGMIMQWGKTGDISDGSTVQVSFPIPFPSACFNVNATGDTITTADNASHFAITSLSATEFDLAYNSTSTVTSKAYWFAIGY